MKCGHFKDKGFLIEKLTKKETNLALSCITDQCMVQGLRTIPVTVCTVKRLPTDILFYAVYRH